MDLLEYLDQMKKIYLDTERQLLEFSYIVPIDENQKLYSPRLYSILQFTCSQVESLMKKIMEILQLKPENRSFKSLYDPLNQMGMLDCQKVILWETEKIIQPFTSNFQLSWWIAYNKTKHGLPVGLKKGTLQNVISAISSAYILNGIVYVLNNSYGDKLPILDKNNWGEITVNDSTMHNLRVLRTYDKRPFLSSFFEWVKAYHDPKLPSADF